jgi:hypothetical protein
MIVSNGAIGFNYFPYYPRISQIYTFSKIISDQVEFKAVTIIVTAWGLRSFWGPEKAGCDCISDFVPNISCCVHSYATNIT